MISPDDLPGRRSSPPSSSPCSPSPSSGGASATPKPEHTRKLVHLGGGIACLFFPFLVTSPWVVLALALAAHRALRGLGSRFGFLKSLHGIGRRSRGAEYYPLSVCLAF